MQTGEIIGDLAKKQGINLRQLAIKAGIPYNTLYAIVKRKSSRVDTETQIKIAKALGVHLRDLSDSSMWEELDRQIGPDRLAELGAESSALDAVAKLSKNEKRLLDILLTLDEPALSAILGYADRLIEESKNNPDKKDVPLDIDSKLETYRHGLLMGIATAESNYSIKPEDIDIDSITLTPELEAMVDAKLEEQRRILEEEQQQNKK